MYQEQVHANSVEQAEAKLLQKLFENCLHSH